ncbi:hypothetical protein THAOC_29866, partial [Thalassiosira oceanica]
YWHLASAARSGFAVCLSRRVGRRASCDARLPARPSASVAFYVRRALRTVASLPKPRPRLGLAPEGRVIAIDSGTTRASSYNGSSEAGEEAGEPTYLRTTGAQMV